MATTQNNPDFALPAAYNGKLPKQWPVTTDQTINLGDLVYWDGFDGTLKPLTSAGQVANVGFNDNGFVGAAEGSAPGLIYGTNDPGSDPIQPSIPALSKGAIYVNSTAGETYNYFDPVTVGADSQTVTKIGVTSSNRVGFVLVDPPKLGSARASAATPVPETDGGSSQVRIVIVLEPKHPAAAAL